MAANGKDHPFEIVSKVWPIKTAKCEHRKVEVFNRADPEQLKEIFLKYASVVEDGEHYMTYRDLIQKYLNFLGENCDEFTLKLFASSVDTSRDGKISFTEFSRLLRLYCACLMPCMLAFQVFDRNGNGYLSCEIIDFHEEHALQAFRRRDKGDTGYINAKDFEEIMCKLKITLDPICKENLVT
ncbi:calcium-binding mitochondrial carrier protein Aralar1-like, partial [Saccostrea cucullata]|uniref:calcium-binding mitochondrial carrier protein Aralar1-like n=1 Tax=Saccostrea cuccullata TaxID=36930 RepID=UPI002ED19F6D